MNSNIKNIDFQSSFDKKIIVQILEKVGSTQFEELSQVEIKMMINQLHNTNEFGSVASIELFLTENCNLRCSYCFVKQKRSKTMSFNTAKKAINFLVFYSGNTDKLHITFFGGEPLLQIDTIAKILKYCEKIEKYTTKKFDFALTTNGTKVTEEIMKVLSPKMHILLSIDGDKETHDKYRKDQNGSGTFDDIINRIELIKSYQGWLGTRMTVVPSEIHKLFNNVEYLYSHGINQFLIALSYGAEWDRESMAIYEQELEKIAGLYKSKIENKEPFRITFFEEDENSLGKLSGSWGCRAGRHSLSIDTHGNIYPCSKFIGLERFNCPEYCLGNINEGIINFQAREDLSMKKGDSFENCKNCKEFDSCTGGCPAENFNRNRSIFIPCREQCEITKIHNRVLRRFWAEQELVKEPMVL